MSDMPIRVTVEDLLTGDTESVDLVDDYVVICAGNRYLASIEAKPMSGIDVVTVKTRKRAGDEE